MYMDTESTTKVTGHRGPGERCIFLVIPKYTQRDTQTTQIYAALLYLLRIGTGVEEQGS